MQAPTAPGMLTCKGRCSCLCLHPCRPGDCAPAESRRWSFTSNGVVGECSSRRQPASSAAAHSACAHDKHPIRGSEMGGQASQAPDSACTSCTSTFLQQQVGSAACFQMLRFMLLRRCAAAPQHAMRRSTRPTISQPSHRQASKLRCRHKKPVSTAVKLLSRALPGSARTRTTINSRRGGC